jgi:hypothetical protein
MTDQKTEEKEQQKITGNVYQLIAAITGELAKEGISKDKKNLQQGYNFRGIDDVYSALSNKLAKYGLCILPKVTARDVSEKTTAKGGTLFYTILTMDYTFVSSHDGTTHTITVIGEAMDSGDKSTNKAMSAAYKYACLQTFCIPTEGDNDADSTTHEVAARLTKEQEASLVEWLEAAKMDKSKLLQAYNVSKLTDLSPAQYQNAVARLKERSGQ